MILSLISQITISSEGRVEYRQVREHSNPQQAERSDGEVGGGIANHNALAGAVGRAWQYGYFRRELR